MELTAADIEAGRGRIADIVRAFDGATLAKAAAHAHAQRASEQPWLIAGMSDGMGLHTAVAAIEAGILKVGLGCYWEPPHFLERNEDGEPVSPVHWARVQNAAALEQWAREKGVDFTVVAADVIMAPERDLKGQAKGAPSAFSAVLRDAFEPIRARAARKDVVFINSVAFGKWISPRDGEEPIAVPTVDFEGRIIEMRTKKYHPRGYEETLDTMGRNHGLLLEAIRGLGWLGPDALTAFFTWAGGSQNVDVLEGIYGKGALGDAKVIAERDIAAFRIAHGLELGAHAIVRLPAFLSAALMGIPGGGLFGLISRDFLEQRGLFEDMPRLAERMMDRMFGPAWIRENPISQVELDTAETLYIADISDRVAEAHRRVEAYWARHPQMREDGIPLAESKRLLGGLASPHYEFLLRRFDPSFRSEDNTGTVELTRHNDNEIEFAVAREDLGGAEFRPDLTLVRALEPLADILGARDSAQLAVYAERLVVDPTRWDDAGDFRCRVSWSNGGGQIHVRRRFLDNTGVEVARGETTIGPRHEHPSAKADPLLLGEAVGPRMPVRVPLHETYDGADALRTVLQGPALIGFARDNLKAAGVFEEQSPRTWEARVDGTVALGDHLLTYIRRDAEGWLVTVVDEESRPLLQMTLR